MSKIKKQNRRAFTLTELLIVVIVIGVLSAVTLPKFNRVIENRKVTEAEEMMSAVRTEQERRCTLDQNYTTNFSALSDVIASANTKNYTYSLQAQGISAKSTSGDYTLKILSYEDGSYCCTGDGCKKLNKNYPDCDTLTFPTSNCAGTEGETTPPGTEPTPVEPEEPECVNGQVTGNQVCNGCGTQTTKACVGGKWVNSLGACSKTAEECAPDPECSGTQPADAVKQCECGTVKASYKCDASTNYQWVQEEFPECPAKPADITETCSDGKTERTKAYTCVNNVWTEGDWDKECPAEEKCTEGETRNGTTPCLNGCGVELQQCVNGEWKAINCVLKPGAECPVGYEQKTKCSDGKSFSIKRCNASCKFEEVQACPELDCSDPSYKASHKAECCPGTPNTDTVCWTPGPLRWGTMVSATDNDALFRCNQKNMYTPHSTCSISCIGDGKASVSNSYCASVSGPCSNYGEVCMMNITYCPIFTGTYNYGKPNCDCQGGEVLNRTYKQCLREYLKNGW